MTLELIIIYLFLNRYIAKKNREETLILDPLFFFILGSSFVYIIIPLMMLIFNWSWHGLNLSEISYIKANLYVFAYISMVVFIYFIFLKISKNNKKSFKRDYNFLKLSKKHYTILILFLFIPIWIDTVYLMKYILSFDFSYYMKNRIILRKGMGLIILISYMGTLLVPILFANFLTKNKRKNGFKFFIRFLFFFVIAVLPFLSAYVVMGNRLTSLILLVILVLLYLIIMKKRFTFMFYIKLILGVLLFLLFFTFLGYMRSIQGNWDQADLNLFFMLINEQIKHALVSNFGNFEHLVWLVEFPKSWELLYGITFLAAFLNVIPRVMWADKLLGGGPHLKNFIHPGSYDLSGENITSYTTGIAIEGFMNFGFLSIIVLSLGHAFLLILLKKMSYKINGNIILLSLYFYLVFTITFLLIFGEFLGVYSRALMVIFPFFLFYFFTKKHYR
jgi:hypothetical protein